MKSWILKLRIFLWTILCVIVFWLLYMAVVPNGNITYKTDFSRDSFFISKLSPAERIKKSKYPILIGDPVYFSLYAPRFFAKARLTLKYREIGADGGGAKVIEAGVLADKSIWRYDLEPLENKIIGELSLGWNTIREESAVLLERKGLDASSSFSSIAEFLNSPPPREKIALYNYDLKSEYIFKDYKNKGGLVFNYSFRGPYQFYTYIKNEVLDFSFHFKDLNKNKDADPVDLNLYYEDALIASRHLDDDGIVTDSGEISAERSLNFKAAELPEGVYKIELRANDDIITERIETAESKLAFINKIWVYEASEGGVKFVTNAKILNAQTTNPARLQAIDFNGAPLQIKETYKLFSLKTTAATSTVITEKDDVILSGGGVFSPSEDAFIDPTFKKADNNLNVDNDGINYILAGYNPPEESGGWKYAEVEFDLSRAYREDGRYGFIISIPGLKVEDKTDYGIEVGEIKVELEGKGLKEKILGE